MVRNVLIVVQGHDHPALFREGLAAADLSWVSGHAPHPDWVYAAKIRYRQADAPCCIRRVDGEGCEIDFAQPQWAVTPGQSVVVYESEVCLGGGKIRKAGWARLRAHAVGYLLSTHHIIPIAAQKNASVGKMALNNGGQSFSSPRWANSRFSKWNPSPSMMPAKIFALTPPDRPW